MKTITKFFVFFVFMFTIISNLNIAYAKTSDVATFEQFQNAVLDPTVTNINITKNISFEKSISQVPVRSLVINGNADKNVLIKFDNDALVFDSKEPSTNVVISIINANITPLSASKYNNFIYKPYNTSALSKTSFYVKDVTFNGSYFISAEKSILTFDGTNKIYTTSANAEAHSIIFKAGSTYESSSGYYATSYDFAFEINRTSDRGWGSVILEEGAKVYFNIGRVYYEGIIKNFAEIIVKNGALIDINTVGTGISVDYDAIVNIENGGTVLIKQVDYTKVLNAPPNANSSPADYLPMDIHGKLNVKSGSNLYISGTTLKGSSTGVLNAHGSECELDFDNPANMDIRNLANNAPAISSDAPIKFNFPSYVLFWDEVLAGDKFDVNPSSVFNNINGTDVSTNNPEFDKVFKQNNSVRIKLSDVEPTKYVIEFDVDGGLPKPDAQNIYAGGKLVEPQNPTKQGFIFEGWYTDSSFTTKWDFNNKITDALNLVAKWATEPTDKYIVTFDVDGGLPKPDTQNVVKGKKVVEPTNPTKQDFVFEGWYTDKTFTTKWDFNKVVTSNLNLVAKWIANSTEKFTVSFDSNGGSNVKPITNVAFGSTIKIPSTPKRIDNCFSGWFVDKELKNRWIFAKNKVYADTTLYAKWCK